MSENTELDKVYDPRAVEPEIFALWEKSGAFRSVPDGSPHSHTFTIVMPPPNVTGALHLGHALNNTLQDILIRYHRMRGFNTLWQPGTDHAGIATQAVVERRIREQEGKTRYQLGDTPERSREELVRRIWQWKDEYEQRILNQLKLMGCSCDWERTRFTLDEGLSRAVRLMFFNLFKDGLIFRGKRLVNWDTQLQTAVSDDEVYHETVKGKFWHFKYPVIKEEGKRQQATGNSKVELDPNPERERRECLPLLQGGIQGGSEPEYVIIATTRPETMLGDTAVAVHPDPAGFLDREEKALKEQLDRLSNRSGKEAAEIQTKLDAIVARRESHLPTLIKLRDMAKAGRKLRLPLVEREIPLICDEWANPMLGSGCVKITPAHDPNDYEVGIRHKLPMINVLTPDGKVATIIEPDSAAAPVKPGTNENAHSHDYAGLLFSSEGRAKVVADLESLGLIESIEDRDIELGHSDRSKLPIEPFLSDQWFLRTDGLQNNTRHSERSEESLALAQSAMNVVEVGTIKVFPPRYAKTYLDWLGEKRDWCISRQLWWGHRIPVWSKRVHFTEKNWPEHIIDTGLDSFIPGRWKGHDTSTCVRFTKADSSQLIDPNTYLSPVVLSTEGEYEITISSIDDEATSRIEKYGYSRDPDVLDTWFSSALWPISTLGWPEETPHLKQYYPGSVLCTSRDIITNWVARMVMFGLYARGQVPFDHVYVHPKILDGRGETMSKSKGNGVDPVDIIHTHGADALRYSMADLTTETQDIRMPVEYLCPHCGKLTEQSGAIKAEEQSRKSRGQKLERKLQPADCTRVKCTHKECGKEFATQWADAETKKKLGIGRETSEKFEIGRNFCNKLWNAARFAFMNLAEPTEPQASACATQSEIEAAGSRELKFAARSIDNRQSAIDNLNFAPEDRWVLAKLSQTIRDYHNCLAGYQFSASVKVLREFFWDCLCDWYIELTKARFTDSNNPSGATAKQVLAFCIDQSLRLWHPTIPFITERLWAQLNTIVPKRGFPGIAESKSDEMLVEAEFPPVEGYPAFDDAEIIGVFGELQDATRGVRELRNTYTVTPREQVQVTVIVPDENLSGFQGQSHILKHMAGIGELHVQSSGSRPSNAASITVNKLRIYVHDISDDATERTRARKSIEMLEKQIAGKESKLSNEQFIAKADPELIAAERGRLDSMLTEREHLRDHLAELGE